MAAYSFKTAGLLATAALALALGGNAATAKILAPGGGQIRAVVVGLDQYNSQIVPTLKGAENDARDLSDTLARAGAAEVKYVHGRNATRAAVVAGLKDLVGRSKPGDMVVISFAGHGTQIPEAVKGSKPDGLDEAYLLFNFAKGVPDLITGPEMKNWLTQFEDAGVDVLYVVDTCYGGGMTRGWDPRSGEFTTRAGGALAALAAADAIKNLQTNATAKDAVRDPSTFKRVTFLAAVDKNTPAPEVDIPIVDASGQRQLVKRGALSYAVARAIDGMPAASEAGLISRADLFTFAKQNVLQYSKSKQLIDTEPSSALDTLVWRSAGAPAVVAKQEQEQAGAPDPRNDKVRVFVFNGDAAVLANVQPFATPFTVVRSNSEAQLVWDAQKKEALVAGDVIAHRIEAQDVPAVVDRVRAVDELIRLSAKAPQPIELLPNNKLHHSGEKVAVKASGVRNKHLIIFNITGDGIVQYLFPKNNDESRIDTAEWKGSNSDVGEPFGWDTVIAISSDQRLEALEGALRKLDGLRKVSQVPKLIEAHLPKPPTAAARVGIANMFTDK
jgi:hypothetical protein